MIIYGLVDPLTKETRYIGATKNITKRLEQHLKDKSNTYKVHWIKKLRRQNLVPEIITIEETSEKEWQNKERFWISYYRKQGARLTNLCDGGQGLINPTNSTRKKLSRAIDNRVALGTWELLKKGFHHSEKTKRRMSKSRIELLTHWKFPEKTKQKISKKLKGKPKSEEHKQHMRHPHKTYKKRGT